MSGRFRQRVKVYIYMYTHTRTYLVFSFQDFLLSEELNTWPKCGVHDLLCGCACSYHLSVEQIIVQISPGWKPHLAEQFLVIIVDGQSPAPLGYVGMKPYEQLGTQVVLNSVHLKYVSFLVDRPHLAL